MDASLRRLLPIVESLENNEVPWDFYELGLPQNVLSGKHYCGLNSILLNIISKKNNYKSCLWGTPNQWSSLQCKIKKRPENIKEGHWGSLIYRLQDFEKVYWDNADYRISETTSPTGFFVFNYDQIFGRGKNQIEQKNKKNIDLLNAFFSEQKIEFNLGEIPHYNRITDKIFIPPEKSFINIGDYYLTKIHEYFHWRENKNGWIDFDDKCELAAEIGSNVLLSIFNIEQPKDNANFMKWKSIWIDKIKKNTDYFHEAVFMAYSVLKEIN